MTLHQLTTALEQTDAVLTFIGAPPGSGRRLGIDRDADVSVLTANFAD